MTSELKIMNRELLERVVQGQAERNITEKSKKTYLSQCKVLTKMLFDAGDDIAEESLEKDDFGNYCKHSGMAKEVYKLILPIKCHIAKLLFAQISIDDSLPRKGRKRTSRNYLLASN